MQPDSNQSGLRTWQWVVTAIVVIVLIVIGIMVFGKKSPAPATPGDTTSTAAPNAPGVNSIVMSDQYPGNVVYISSVQLANAGWVVIHKDNKGAPGAIIGSAWSEAGINPVKITLSEPMIDGSTYYAMLHSDNGDKKFDAAVDMPLKDSNNNVIMRVFRSSVTAEQNTKG